MTSQRRLRHCLWAIVALTALLNGCASHNGTVVLLPEKDRRETALAVRDRDREVVLSEPYAAVRQAIFGPMPYASSPQEVETLFGAALVMGFIIGHTKCSEAEVTLEAAAFLFPEAPERAKQA